MATATSDVPPPIRVLVVDDHPMMRQGLHSLIAHEADMLLVGEASRGDEAVEAFRRLQPDVVLMDLQMQGGDGLDAIRSIREVSPEANIVVLTSYAGDARIARALALGARAYLLKAAGAQEILRAMRAAVRGRQTVSPAAARQLADRVGTEALTSREVAVLRLVALGQGNRAIAASLLVSEETVKSRVRSIFAKLGADDRTHAVTLARERGFLDP
ncbi:response regulator transcription factor [Luteibacter sp. SG786]|uniref:response regulator n=1 Tax=Luteibacter sp. SG786 TaxID=2587130 RepID=UPI00141F6668|nr:response regulator transcription factor [Luteibacter sp. SG786]NII55145.1 DNA-binding NarL/FixJ family response regulator [Luteibacter sp. SG786]